MRELPPGLASNHFSDPTEGDAQLAKLCGANRNRTGAVCLESSRADHYTIAPLLLPIFPEEFYLIFENFKAK